MQHERAAELLAMLCAKVAHMEPTIAGFGVLQRYDVAHAIALIKNLPAQMLVRIKYADEVSNTETFEDQLCAAIERGYLAHVVEFAAPQRWKVPRRTFLRDMCRLALIEYINPKLCYRCDGRGGWINRKALKVTCVECGGSGEGTYSDRQRARVLGVHEASWRQSWRDRYRAIQGVLDHYDGIGLGAIAKRFSG